MKEMNRREFLTLTGAAVVALSLAGCGGAPSAPTPPDDIRVQQALDALNQFRRDKGLTELVYEKDLEELTDLLISPFVKEGTPVVDRTKFSSYVDAKKYGIDYAIRKDTSEVPPRYLVFFKAPDAEAFHSAFKEYSASLLNKDKRPSVLARLQELVQAAAELSGKVRRKQEERGL